MLRKLWQTVSLRVGNGIALDDFDRKTYILAVMLEELHKRKSNKPGLQELQPLEPEEE